MGKIAVFADIEHVKLSFEGFKSALNAIKSMGDIASCKFYNFKPVKHAEYAEFINENGYEAVSFLNVKFNRNKTDMRLVLDAYSTAMNNPGIDTIFVIAEGYIVPLVAGLKRFGKTVIVGVTEDIDNIKAIAHGTVKLPVANPKPARIAAPKQQKAIPASKRNNDLDEASVDDLDILLNSYVEKKKR